MKAEYQADQAERSAFEKAEQLSKQEREAAARSLVETSQTANSQMKSSIDEARQQFEHTKANAVRQLVEEKDSGKQASAAAYAAADEQERAAVQQERARFEARTKQVEETRKATIQNAKHLTDQKLASIDEEVQAQKDHATHTMRRTIEYATKAAADATLKPAQPAGSVSMLQLDPAELSQAQGLDLSTEEMIKRNREQSAADETEAQKATQEYEKQAAEALDAVKFEAAKAQEADEQQMIDSEMNKSAQAASTFATQAMARVQMKHASDHDRLEDKVKADEQRTAAKSTAAKLEETHRKQTIYTEASKEWAIAKQRARDEELATFQKLEAGQQKELEAAQQEKAATLKAAAADRDVMKTEAAKAKAEQIAAANKQKSEAIAAAVNSKAAVMKQLELQMAEDPETSNEQPIAADSSAAEVEPDPI